MNILDDRYAVVYRHKGFDICVLKVADLSMCFGYRIDSQWFKGKEYETVQDAIDAIDSSDKTKFESY